MQNWKATVLTQKAWAMENTDIRILAEFHARNNEEDFLSVRDNSWDLQNALASPLISKTADGRDLGQMTLSQHCCKSGGR